MHLWIGATLVASHGVSSMESACIDGQPFLVAAQKVLMMTDHLPCGGEVTIDVDDDTPKHEIMEKLFKATGVPVEHQVVRLG